MRIGNDNLEGSSLHNRLYDGKSVTRGFLGVIGVKKMSQSIEIGINKNNNNNNKLFNEKLDKNEL